MIRARLFSLIFIFAPFMAHAEYIERFATDIEVREDASFTVTETIEYVFTEERHGIFREIPLIHTEKASASWKERIIAIKLENVTMDGEAVPYVLESTKDTFFVRIGDANSTVDGMHTYVLTYDVGGGLSYPVGQGTELYWNVTGNDWQVPIRVVEATLRDPDGVFRQARSCYRGVVGEAVGGCIGALREDGTVFFRSTEFYPYEGMTVAQDLDATRVAKDIRERTKVLLFAVPLGLLVLLYGVYRLYRYKTAHKTNAPIIPEYEPYPDMKPMYTGLLMDGRLDPRDITACIVYLAEQGYLKIRKTEKKALFMFDVDDYEIELIKLPDEGISLFEKGVLEVFFNSPLIVGKIISLQDLKNDLHEQRRNYQEIRLLQTVLDKDLIQSGFYESKEKSRMMQGLFLILVLFLPVMLIWEGTVVGFIALISFIPLGFIMLFLKRRRTARGYEIQDYLKGFKLFLETTERDRYLFHNAPEKSPEQFMEFLPYAIAFGVEEKWAKVFEGITIPNPSWYDGGSVSSFSATNLTSSLGAFSTAFASSSGASASAGGGSSGGGSGGGGGGSW